MAEQTPPIPDPEQPPPSPPTGADGQEDLQVPDYAVPQISFWQQPWVQSFLPLATSIALHIGLVVIGLIFARAVVEYRQITQEQIIIPEAAIVDGAPVGGIPNPGLGGDPNRAAAQDQFDVATAAEGWAERPSETFSQSLMGGGAGDEDSAAIAMGPNLGFGRGSGSGAGVGEGLGAGTGDGGGQLAPFGIVGGGGGLGPKSPFMGISGNARKVVYICDASGSMLSVFHSVQRELKRAIDVLKPVQGFNVIFFADERTEALSKGELVMATAANKRKAYDFADKMSAVGGTHPIPAVRLAFQQQPDLIYILTDGFDRIDSFDAIVDEFRKLNTDKKVKVNTILIRAASDPELEQVLRTIATENGGILKIVEKYKF